VAFVIGGMAAQMLPPVYGRGMEVQGTQVKGPKWQYGLSVRVRKGDENDFTKDTKRFGLEVYRDENTNNLIYMSETGSIAVVPAK
jgi:hypothetical protein